MSGAPVGVGHPPGFPPGKGQVDKAGPHREGGKIFELGHPAGVELDDAARLAQLAENEGLLHEGRLEKFQAHSQLVKEGGADLKRRVQHQAGPEGGVVPLQARSRAHLLSEAEEEEGNHLGSGQTQEVAYAALPIQVVGQIVGRQTEGHPGRKNGPQHARLGDGAVVPPLQFPGQPPAGQLHQLGHPPALGSKHLEKKEK